MLLRVLGLGASFLILCAADYSPPPPALAPYIKDGRFEPGDYGWMRGGFDDSTKAEKDEYDQLNSWVNRCIDEARQRLRAQLAAVGFPDPRLDHLPIGPLACVQVSAQPFITDRRSFAAFQQTLSRVKPIADTFVAATNLAERIGGPRGTSLADALAARPLGEQMLRFATSWGTGSMTEVPQLGADERMIFLSRIEIEIAARDYDNTQWLKAKVANRRWPRRSQVGDAGAKSAWLIVQHADFDPLFQLEALRLMEPLRQAGEVSKTDYAYLYDRVMLKLTGKQRYATQLECRNGALAPQPVEDEQAVPRLRSEAGMPPLDQYIAQTRRSFGPCISPPGT